MSKIRLNYEIKKVCRKLMGSEAKDYYVTQLVQRPQVRRTTYLKFCHQYYKVKEAAMHDCLAVAVDALLRGLWANEPVAVPYFGTFKLICHAKAVEDPSDAGRKAIYGLKIEFRPSKELREALDMDNFVFIDKTKPEEE